MCNYISNPYTFLLTQEKTKTALSPSEDRDFEPISKLLEDKMSCMAESIECRNTVTGSIMITNERRRGEGHEVIKHSSLKQS